MRLRKSIGIMLVVLVNLAPFPASAAGGRAVSPPVRAASNAIHVAATAPSPPAQTSQPKKPPFFKAITDYISDHDLVDALMDAGPAAIHVIAAISAVVLTGLCIQPIVAFTQRGWKIKQADVVSSLSERSKKFYLLRFQDQPSKQPAKDFEEMYNFRYGLYRLRIPTIILLFITYPLMFLLCETSLAHLLLTSSSHWHRLGGEPEFPHLLVLPRAAAAAIAGAFTWTVASLIQGATRYTLPPGDIVVGSLRMAIAAPLGYAVAPVLGPGQAVAAPAIAFGLGAFPLDTIQLLLRRILNKFGLDIGTADDKVQVTQLDGVDKPLADRLSQADISTIAQLAHCDPVQVSMRTNINFDAVTDAQSQALAWIYFADLLPTMRPMGMRGALEISGLLRDLRSDVAQTRDQAGSCFAELVEVLKIPQASLMRAFTEVTCDPYTQFLAIILADADEKEQSGAPPITAPQQQAAPAAQSAAAAPGALNPAAA